MSTEKFLGSVGSALCTTSGYVMMIALLNIKLPTISQSIFIFILGVGMTVVGNYIKTN